MKLVAAAVVMALTGVVGVVGGSAVSAQTSNAPVKIMVMGAFRAPGIDISDVPNAAKAAARAINRSGGIDGAKVQIVECNQGVDPNRAADCARRAASDGMVALAGTFSSDGASFVPILDAEKIPNVATLALGFEELNSPMSYPIGGGLLSAAAGPGAVVADQGAKTIDVPYLDIPGGVGALAATIVSFATEPRGVTTLTDTPVPLGGADLLPSVQTTIGKDTEGVVLELTDPELTQWLAAYRQSGGEAKVGVSGASLTESAIEVLGDAIDGAYLANSYKLATVRRDPGVRKMLKEVRAYDSSIELTDPAIGAWAGVHLIAEALTGAPEKTSAALITALGEDREWETGVTPPVNFTKPAAEIASNPLLAGQITRLFNVAVYYGQVKDSKIKPLGSEPHNPLGAD